MFRSVETLSEMSETTVPLDAFIARSIVFRHPAYSDARNQNVLFRLLRLDCPNFSIQYGFAHTACAIVAANAFHGYLSLTRTGDRLELPWHATLDKDSYYFNVSYPQDTEQSSPLPQLQDHPFNYPVCPAFEFWTFPHEIRPDQWRTRRELTSTITNSLPSPSNLSVAVLARDLACCVTGQVDYREAAHLCPKAQSEWFGQNRMHEYCRNPVLPPDYMLDDTRNAIALRMDIHRAFDDRKFVLTPGGTSSDDWTVRFIQPTADLGVCYNAVSVKLKAEIAPEFLLVRLAWAIFPFVQDFLTSTVLRNVCIPKLTEEGEEQVIERWNRDKMQKYLQQKRRPRSESPKKRKGAEQEESPTDGYEQRTRKRRRQNSSSIDSNSMSQDFYQAYFIFWLTDVFAAGLTSPTLSSQSPGTPDSLSHAEPIQSPNRNNPAQRTHPMPTAYTDDEYTPLEKLASEWRRKGRPTNRALLCCDYTAAEMEQRAGLAGKPELDGHYICRKCAGLDEYYGEDPSFCDS